MDKRLGSSARSGLALMCLTVVAGCGLYGEQGFSGRNPLSPERFIEEVDEECREANEALDEDVAELLTGNLTEVDDPKDAIAELMRHDDDLAEKLGRIIGPDDLEERRDQFTEALGDIDASLDEARDLVEDDPAAADALMGEVKVGFTEAEAQLRSSGFTVCGLPRRQADE